MSIRMMNEINELKKQVAELQKAVAELKGNRPTLTKGKKVANG